ncbi:MAG: electron transfer flavoprotein subunit alpha/FixB family protein [Thermoanaerobaculia bacterium]|nr:electron transfer flavoprotein subunit alpha/FixB family protein [Thermoanaerobaculia bacterium]
MATKIWVILQQQNGELNALSKETLAAGAHLARLTDGSMEGVLLGSGIDVLADEIAGEIDMTALHVADDPLLERYTPEGYAGVLTGAIRRSAPDYLLFPHTYQSMDYFPRLAQRVDGVLVPGVEAVSEEEGSIVWTRPVLGGKLQSRVRVKTDFVGRPVLASIQSGAYSGEEAPSGTAARSPLPVPADEIGSPREILAEEQAAEDEVDLSKANVIVAAGRGVGGEEKMQVIHDLADTLGAEVGASRPVIDNEWLPRDRQIGSSGQTVAPKLYIAVGISGAIQHLVGMKGSGVVVAVNKDPNAPIFSVADYGIVGDLHEVLPALTEAIRGAKG